jgi:hypothetical protein
MPMPKTAVHKYHFASGWKHNVGCTWEITTIKPKSVSERMKELPDDYLRDSISPTDSGHQRASTLRGAVVDHSPSL